MTNEQKMGPYMQTVEPTPRQKSFLPWQMRCCGQEARQHYRSDTSEAVKSVYAVWVCSKCRLVEEQLIGAINGRQAYPVEGSRDSSFG